MLDTWLTGWWDSSTSSLALRKHQGDVGIVVNAKKNYPCPLIKLVVVGNFTYLLSNVYIASTEKDIITKIG